MSETCGMSITIGGTLSKEKAKELLKAINDDMWDLYDCPDTVEDITPDNNRWGGQSSSGTCDTVIKFCEENNLTYLHNWNSGSEWDAGNAFWKPGSKVVSNVATEQGGEVVFISDIKPRLLFVLDLAEKGTAVLAKWATDEETSKEVREAAQEILKNPDTNAAIICRELFDDVLREEEEVPPLIIEE